MVSRWDDDGVRMEVDDAEDLANGVGSMHGGVVATLVDTVANAAAITVGEPDARYAGRDGVDDGELPRRPHTAVSSPTRCAVVAVAACDQ